MAWRSKPQPQPATLPEQCDRCPAAANVRVAKTVSILHEYQGEPHAVDSRELDLVLCAGHFMKHQTALVDAGWRVQAAVGAP